MTTSKSSVLVNISLLPMFVSFVPINPSEVPNHFFLGNKLGSLCYPASGREATVCCVSSQRELRGIVRGKIQQLERPEIESVHEKFEFDSQ